MLPKVLKFTVPGNPEGKARPRFTKAGRAYTSKKTKDYEKKIRKEFERNFPEWIPSNKCIGIHFRAYFTPPKGMPKKQRYYIQSETLRRPKKPDYDNIGKIACDALNGIAYIDDNQITDGGDVIKRYSYNPRLEIEIELLEEIDI